MFGRHIELAAFASAFESYYFVGDKNKSNCIDVQVYQLKVRGIVSPLSLVESK